MAWRNRTRRFSLSSILDAAMFVLQSPAADRVEEMRKAPWQVLLIVKWVCQDRMMHLNVGKTIQPREFDGLRQDVWNFPEIIRAEPRDTLPGLLLFRQLTNPQINFQRRFTPGFVREAAILARQTSVHPLVTMFREKTGLDPSQFIDFALSMYAAILPTDAPGRRMLDIGWLRNLRPSYSDSAVDAFIHSISKTKHELVGFFRDIPNSGGPRLASEMYEFPILSRYPFLRREAVLQCWHPAVFFRGMEGFVHSVLSEAGQDYMDRFSRLFESHVIEEAKSIGVRFFDEQDLRSWLPSDAEVPDGLLSIEGCNVFVESKAGLFDETYMTVGHSEYLGRKLRAIRKAAQQGWSAVEGISSGSVAPADVAKVAQNYLIIVTNREVSAAHGRHLAGMFPPGEFQPPSAKAGALLPLEHIYAMSIEDFERLAASARTRSIDLPQFLANCVIADSDPSTSVYFFEQHLDRNKVPMARSELVTSAIDSAIARLQRVLPGG